MYDYISKLDQLILDPDNMQNELKLFYQLWSEFQDAYDALKDLLTEEQKTTEDDWRIEQTRNLMDFKNKMSNWVIVAKQHNEDPI